MSDLALNLKNTTTFDENQPSQDVLIVNGDLVFQSNTLDIIQQNLTQNIRFFFGEWFLDVLKGVPYTQAIITKNPDPIIVEASYISAIFATPGIISLNFFRTAVDTATRVLTVEFEVLTSEGPLFFSEEFI